ncbi:MAG: hypothetical protein GF393_11630, partial [Armatimonadia bacterium]|nr:hypothetical protein [Armatimonadia bacterium]
MLRRLMMGSVAAMLVVSICLADGANFAGMTLSELPQAQLTEMETAYGEQAGVAVTAVAEGSLAAKTGVRAGDVLMAVREAQETDYYPIPPFIDDMVTYAQQTQPDAKMRLLVLRNVNGTWYHLYGMLGQPFGVEVPDGVLTADAGQIQDYVAGGGQQPAGTTPDVGQAAAAVGRHLPGCSFTSTDPTAVLANAPGGQPLTQQDVDIYGGLLAWAFGTTLTEGQKGIVHSALVQFWQMAPADALGFFDQGVRQIPNLLPTLSEADRESLRQDFQNTFVTTAQSAPQLPLAQVIMQVANSNQQVLAGAGTGIELTVQDVNALLE